MGGRLTLALLVGVLAAATPLRGHHEWPIDESKTITIKGTVSSVRWGNPHVMIYLDVDASGTPEKWTVGGSSPQYMTTCGWTKKTLNPGDVVTVVGYRYKDGSNTARMITTTVPGGKELSYGAPPTRQADCARRP